MEKRSLLTQSLTLFLAIFYLSPLLSARKDDFYTRLFKSGKKSYLQGSYEEAARDLKIAEFGLYERPEILKELYLYYALANYKLKRGDRVVEISRKILDIFGVKDAAKIKKPEIIENDLDTMFSAVFKNYRSSQQEIIPKRGEGKSRERKSRSSEIGKEKKFKIKFSEIRSYLDANLLKETEKGIKELKKIKRRDPRIIYLKGVLYFRKGDYKNAVDSLSSISKKNISGLKEDLYYYLSLSNYFEKNYGQAVAFSQKITKTELRRKLSDILKKVRTLRRNMIIKNSNSLFDKKLFHQMIKKFEGDNFIPADVLKEAIRVEKTGRKQIKKLINYCLKHPGIYEKNFILLASDYFSEKNDIKYSINILKESKFFPQEKPENTEIFYRTAIGYYKLRSIRKAKKLFNKVLTLSPSYKKTYFYLDNLKSLN